MLLSGMVTLVRNEREYMAVTTSQAPHVTKFRDRGNNLGGGRRIEDTPPTNPGNPGMGDDMETGSGMQQRVQPVRNSTSKEMGSRKA
jgi:hypothetical protein